ncbi:BN159_2729 family protein [Streptomyces sp. NPDC090026]|uniref:BN159_2729 family protein n=1 Tax=Streptomyces sp. NPDC090026 TaxID=3365923 RepID=UPI0038036EFC
MNKNLPAAADLIVSTIGCSRSYAETLAHALNKAGLLVDPERTHGIVLHRRATGGWSRTPRTELETQALAWDRSCRRAADVAARIEKECRGAGSGLLGVRLDGDRILVSAQITDTQQLAEWRAYLGITSDDVQPLEYVDVEQGHRDGVAVGLTAYDAREAAARAAAATMPYRHGGVVYDLAIPHEDAQGDVWDYVGLREDGTPLLTMRGAAERCSLPNVVEYVGPLSPRRDAESVPGVREAADVEGGERS